MRPPVGINRRDITQAPTAFLEIVSDLVVSGKMYHVSYDGGSSEEME